MNTEELTKKILEILKVFSEQQLRIVYQMVKNMKD